MQVKEFSTEIAGRTLKALFSDLADQTNSSVIVSYGDTTVLVTAVMGRENKEGSDFFPLTVDYEEKYYAAGRILGGRFMKREGKPSDEAILSGRIIDRTIRPLFDQRLRREVQIVVTVLAVDEVNDPASLGVIGASLALGTSDIPWGGPASAVRIGLNNQTGELVVNPIVKDAEEAKKYVLDLLICGKDGNIGMIEAEAREVGEEKVTEAWNLAVAEIEKIQDYQKKIIAEIGKTKHVIEIPELSPEARALFDSEIAPRIRQVVFEPKRKGEVYDLQSEWLKLYTEKFPNTDSNPALTHYETTVDDLVHREALEKNARADGRAMDQVRSLYAQAGGVSRLLHGTGIFYRGETHVLSVLTLGSPKDAQLIEGMEVRGEKRFMHHYNFPPFSSGEVGRMGNTNRRAIGHGALAEKALRAILPDETAFPYTIRIVSESIASNGSTSQASICASSLALADGGVPIKGHIAGIAMGLMSDPKNPSTYKILTDIQGPEDHYGDMDFKVAGTRAGITAIQLDIKVGGISPQVLGEALTAARTARLHIIDTLEAAIPTPRSETSAAAPKIEKVKIPQDEIGMLIGTGGKTINGIIAQTGAEIDIGEDGTVMIFGRNGSAVEAKKVIEQMFRTFVAGETADGIVTKIMDFGIFVEIAPNREGLVHISEIAPFRVDSLAKWFKEGESVPVVVKEIDHMGRINLSIKQRDPEFAAKKGITASTTPPPPPHGDRPPRRFNDHPRN